VVSLALTLCMIKRLSANEDFRDGDKTGRIDDYADADMRIGRRQHIAPMTFRGEERRVGMIDGTAEKVAEFELPITFDVYYHIFRHAGCLDVSQGTIALAIGQIDAAQSLFDVVSSYFIQVVFD